MCDETNGESINPFGLVYTREKRARLEETVQGVYYVSLLERESDLVDR
jgi:hypothetical protein